MKETFKDFLERTLPYLDYTVGLERELGSMNMRARLLNNPRRATHHQCLQFAKLTGVSAWELMCRFELGKNKVSELEQEKMRALAEAEMAA